MGDVGTGASPERRPPPATDTRHVRPPLSTDRARPRLAPRTGFRAACASKDTRGSLSRVSNTWSRAAAPSAPPPRGAGGTRPRALAPCACGLRPFAARARGHPTHRRAQPQPDRPPPRGNRHHHRPCMRRWSAVRGASTRPRRARRHPQL
jgi:hypothetical protein